MSIYDIAVTTIDGKRDTLATYQGQVLLIVNVASQCGLTPQYRGLEALYRQYRDQGVTVLGFPCNQFGAQEPGTEQEIQSFCSTAHGVSFPLFAKIEVNGARAHPLYQYLKSCRKGLFGRRIKWNFTKFLVNQHGAVVKRYAPSAKPEGITADIEQLVSRPSRG